MRFFKKAAPPATWAIDYNAGFKKYAANRKAADAVWAPFLAEWQAEMDACVEALEKPTTPYRIVKDELAGTHVVQKWEISRTSSPRYDLIETPEEAQQALARAIEIREKYPSIWAFATIQWRAFGPSNPFPTFEAAEAWLKAWIRPITNEVYFDENGERV